MNPSPAPRAKSFSARPPSKSQRKRQEAIRRFFGGPAVELGIAVLVLLSVALTLLEFAIDESSEQPATNIRLAYIVWINHIISAIFVVELTLRFMAASNKRRFFREYWVDIVAVTPLFFFYFERLGIVRLLRLVRLLRMFGVMSRLSGHFPDIMRKGFKEYLVVCGILALTLVFGTAAMVLLDDVPLQGEDDVSLQGEQVQATTLERSFWFNVYSLFAAEPIPDLPRTAGGKIVAVAIMFMGLTIFAMFTGTVSAFMVERLRSENKPVEPDQLRDHIVICGWNSKAEIIVGEYREALGQNTPIIVIAEMEPDPPYISADVHKNVTFLNDDFTRVAALERANIRGARRCVILSDTSGGRSEQDADARTILAALTVEKLNPDVYTCAELLNRSYAHHLNLGQVDDHVVSGEYGAYLLAQASLNRGLMDVFSELLTYQRGCEFYRVALPEQYLGRTFTELLTQLKDSHNAILAGVFHEGKTLKINPAEYTFGPGDEIVVIAEGEFKL